MKHAHSLTRAILSTMALGLACVSTTVLGADSPQDIEAAMAEAVAALANAADLVNIYNAGYILKLPALAQELKWMGPQTGLQFPNFSAYYDPPESILGIKKVVIFWNVWVPPAEPGIHYRLVIALKEGSCLSEAALTRAIGRAPTEVRAYQHDEPIGLGPHEPLPPYTYKLYTLQRTQGPPTTIRIANNKACDIELARLREQ